MKILKIIINFLNFKKEKKKTNKKIIEYARNKYGFISKVFVKNKELPLNNKK
tara:strand:- start:207 stop:362 length:156 start_codon:yes stop_codon:yes gene_type:complete